MRNSIPDGFIEGLAFGVIPVYVSDNHDRYMGRGPISQVFVDITGHMWEFAASLFQMIVPEFKDQGIPIKIWT